MGGLGWGGWSAIPSCSKLHLDHGRVVFTDTWRAATSGFRQPAALGMLAVLVGLFVYFISIDASACTIM